MPLYHQFCSVIESYIQPNSRLVLALSGGVDSSVLLALMAQYGKERNIECLAIHVNHGLSEHADRWAEQCHNWCHQLSVGFRLEQVSLDLKGRSLEESARESRYRALSKHLQNGDLLLTGQHSDDQLETFLLALKRGSGPKGLSAMAESMTYQQAKIIRPLLNINRQQIESFAAENGIEWVEDESNQDQRFDRNFLRHQVTPLLNKRWPHIAQSVNRSAQLCAEQEALLDELLADKLNQLCHCDNSLLINKVDKLSEPMRARLLRMWLGRFEPRMPSREQIKLIWQQVALAQADANPILNLPNGQVRRFAHRLYFVAAFEDVSSWQASMMMGDSVSLPDGLGRLSLSLSNKGTLSSESLSENPLRIHFDPEGLIAHPSDRGHSRKLKKLFQEYAIPSWQRRRMPILMCGDRVVAIADLFVDRHFVGQDCELIWDK